MKKKRTTCAGFVWIWLCWVLFPTRVDSQCNPPFNMLVVSVTETTATLRWTSANPPVADHCWTLEIGAQGFSCGNGQQVVETTICQGQPGVSVNGATITYTTGGLQPGTSYDWTLVETCDGIPGTNSGACSNAQGPAIITLDAQFQVNWTAMQPSCPEVSPGYSPNGSFVLNVADGVTCSGVFNVAVFPIADSSPLGNTPATPIPASYLGFGQGNFNFANAGAGQYSVVVTEVGPCNPPSNPVVTIVTVPDGIDAEPPIWYITDLLGNIVVDNDPNTVAPSDLIISTQADPTLLPEGECGFQQQLFAYGFDNCDGLIVNPGAASVSATTTPATIDPGTQTSVIFGGGAQEVFFYLIDIFWSIGNSTVTAQMFDAAGNAAPLSITAFYQDNVNPSIAGPAQNYTIPFCQTTISPVFGFTIDDGCDDFINDASLAVSISGFPGATATRFFPVAGTQNGYVEYRLNDLTAGAGFLTITYTDFFGNSTTIQPEITVQQAAQDLPPVIDAPGNLTYHIPACQATSFAIGSFQIWDDCDDIDPAQVVFNNGGSGFAVTFTNVDDDNNSAYFEYSGDIAPGTYLMSVSYQGAFIDWLINVTQDAPQPPDIILPGNLNFTIPVCQVGVTATFAVQILDECDATIVLANAEFLFDGQPLTPSFSNEQAGYFEFTYNFTPADNGKLLIASYTDGDGLTTTVDALITVTDQPDNWAPIIVYPSQNIQVNLDPCDPGPALVFFEVTATDNCDGDLSPTVSASPSQGITLLTIGSPGGDTYLALADPGTYQILIEAQDGSGNTRQEDFVIQVNQDPAPQPDLACNDTINVALNAVCQVVVVPDMVLEGEFGCLQNSDFNINILDGNPANGGLLDGFGVFPYEISLNTPQPINGFTSDFAPGNWTITIQGGGSLQFSPDGATLTLNSGSLFNFLDPAFAGAAISIPSAGSLSFNWNFDGNDPGFDFFGYLIDDNGNTVVDFSTDQQGSGSVQEFVEAGYVLAIFIISPFDQFIASQAVISNFIFEPSLATDPGDFTTCWGYIHAEDKTNPEINCPQNTSQATLERPVQFVQGVLENSDPKLALADHSCFLDFANPSPGLHPYDLYTFTVTAEDIYTFDLATSWGGGLAALFQGPFDPENPCSNIIAQGDFVFNGTLVDFFPFDPVLRIALPLQPGQTYTLLTSSNGNFGTGLTGTYSWAIYSDGAGQLSGIPVSAETIVRDLICTDLDEILLDNLPADIPRCYKTDGEGNLLFPSNPVERQRLEQLLRVLGYTGFPNNGALSMGGNVRDNCGTIEICITEQVEHNGDCGPAVLSRTFTATDESGNSAACTQVITVRKPVRDDVLLPPFTATLECDEQFDLDANGNPHPSVTGYPFIQTAFGFFDLNPVYCNLGATYEDSPLIEVCESGYKLVRTWTLVDWCNPSPVVTYPQVIKVGDYTGPVVSCPVVDEDGDGQPDPIVYSTGPFACVAAFHAPLPVVSDNCSSWEVLTEIVTYIDSEPVVLFVIPPDAPNRYVNSIPAGCHQFRYTVTDDCGNTTVIECDFCVEDQVEPVASCKDQLHVSLGGNGQARVYAADINEQSWDNCSGLTLEVRRLVENDPQSCQPVAPYFTDWGPHVDFTCCDVNELITVELRVTDASGNFSVCWTQILIEDKLRPMCVPPHDTAIDCDGLPYDFDPFNTVQLQSLFGEPQADDNCSAIWEELTPIVNLHDCGFGTIIRRFRAVDHVGNISNNPCQQLIVINESHNYEIKFPKDGEGNCGEIQADTIELHELACDLLAVSLTDEIFSASGDECFKVFRTYRVINWCEYDGISEPIVISRDEDCDDAPGDEDVWVLRRESATYVDRDRNEANANPLAGTKGTACDGATNPQGYWRTTPSVGYWEYTQVIKVHDNVPPDVSFELPEPFCSFDETDCMAIVDYPFQVIENCTPNDLSFRIFYDEHSDGIIDAELDSTGAVTGGYPKFKILGEYPLGMHTFQVHVEDGCGNVTLAILPFEVVDCKPPSPVCINGLVITLMPVLPDTDADGDGDIDTGAFTLAATDFIASPNMDCVPPITYSINFFGQTPDRQQDAIVFTCDDLGPQIVEIYGWDSAFNPYAIQPDGTLGGPNYDHCETYVLVQDNVASVCEPLIVAIFSGIIETETYNPVQNVTVNLSGQSTATTSTNNNGGYFFPNLTLGYNYTITPYKNTNHTNGVSTFDLVLITKHILGVQPLGSPYRMIAADVNNSGSISTVDMIQVRKLILAIDAEFPNNTSWRFVPKDYVFPDPSDPWLEIVPESIHIDEQADPAAIINLDFVAIKIGDVNGSANTQNLAGVDERSFDGSFIFDVPDRELRKGETYSIDFLARDLPNVLGYQFTLAFDRSALELVDIGYGVAKQENFGLTFEGEGMITTSWHRPGTRMETENRMFTLVFKALADRRLSDLLSVSSRYTQAEAYSLSLELLDVAIDFGRQSLPGPAFRLYPNRPNPFRESTVVAFDLPNAAAATLNVYDITGRIVKFIKGDYGKGYNEIIIDGNELPVGVLYYSLEVEGHKAVREMVRMR